MCGPLPPVVTDGDPPVRSLRAEHGTLRDDAGLEIAPEGDQELPRQRHDADLARATRARPELLLVPLGERALGLVAEPRPRRVDRQRAHPAIAGLRDPLLVL